MTLGGILGSRLIKKGLLPWWTAGGLISRSDVIAAYKAVNAGSKAIALTDLTGVQGILNENGTVTYAAATGINGFSDANYMTGGYNWSTNYSFAVRWSGASGAAYRPVINSVGNQISCIPWSDGNYYFINNNKYWAAAQQAAGIMIITPSTCYLNGISLGAATGVGYGTYTGANWRIGRSVATGSVPFLGNWLAMVIYNGTLTAPQVTALNTAMAAL